MASVPTIETTIRAILDEIKKYSIRGGQIFPIVPINVNLQEKNYMVEEIESALGAMVEDGLLEPTDGPHWKLTDSGFAEL